MAMIAERLGLSVHTVNAYLGSATIKLDSVNRIQAIAKAIRLGADLVGQAAGAHDWQRARHTALTGLAIGSSTNTADVTLGGSIGWGAGCLLPALLALPAGPASAQPAQISSWIAAARDQARSCRRIPPTAQSRTRAPNTQ